MVVVCGRGEGASVMLVLTLLMLRCVDAVRVFLRVVNMVDLQK